MNPWIPHFEETADFFTIGNTTTPDGQTIEDETPLYTGIKCNLLKEQQRLVSVAGQGH